MTFRPSDDILEQMESSQGAWVSINQYDNGNSQDWAYVFGGSENTDNSQNLQWEDDINSIIADFPVEEVKAPDLSDLLKDSWDDMISTNSQLQKIDDGIAWDWIANLNESLLDMWAIDWGLVFENQNNKEILQWNEINEEISQWSEPNEVIENTDVENTGVDNTTQEIQWVVDLESEDSWKLSDAKREEIAWSVEWSISCNLDLLVDEKWLDFIKKYKKISNLVFKWGVLCICMVAGIVWGVISQVKWNYANDVKMVDDSTIRNKYRRQEQTADKVLSVLSEDDIDVDVVIPYWSVSLDDKYFQSKSNLISYNGIVLPQLAFIDYNVEDFISLDAFDEWNVSREDLERLMKYLIIDDLIYKKAWNLPNASDIRRAPNTFDWWLVKWFNLWCLYNNKASNFVCDKFVDTFNKYGKFFDLWWYASELMSIWEEMKKEGKDVEPICDMIREYTLRAWEAPDTLLSLMENCGAYDFLFYRKLSNFIELEKSLSQPELSDKVYDDPDLNAYKLLSAQQNVYKILDGTSINENYIKSYLKYVQALINKDKGNNVYLHPIYKNLLYVFNMDQLYQRLIQKWKLSSEIKIQIDQINNWNSLYWYTSLLSLLTVPNIVKWDVDLSSVAVGQRTLEDIFSPYYAMTDRLKIRKAVPISDYELKVQTELFTDRILDVTDWETLKVSLVLYRQDNVLYVSSVKIANQPKFSDILWIYALEGNVTFYAMLNYIDEQVEMRYEPPVDEAEEEFDLCSELQWHDDFSVYSCDDTNVSLYKWDIEYNFVLVDGKLDSFDVSDEDLDRLIKEKLEWFMFMKEDTPMIIRSVIDFSMESEKYDNNLEKKLDIVNQFRIHFKLVPDKVDDIEWKSDEFLVSFVLWDFSLQGIYNIDTHVLTKVSYVACGKTLEIKWLSLMITVDNEPQLIEILNNPKVYLVQINSAAYKKYQKMCIEKPVTKD